MKGAIRRSFFPLLVLIVLVSTMALANEMITGKRADVREYVFYGEKGSVGLNASPAGSIITGPAVSGPGMDTPISGYTRAELPAWVASEFFNYSRSKKKPGVSSGPDTDAPFHYVPGDAYYYTGPPAKVNKSTPDMPKFGHGIINITKIDEGYGWYGSYPSNAPGVSTESIP